MIPLIWLTFALPLAGVLTLKAWIIRPSPGLQGGKCCWPGGGIGRLCRRRGRFF